MTQQVEGTTVFTRDSGIREAQQTSAVDLDPVFYKSPEDMSETSLAFYLSRPLKLASGVFSTTDSATTFTPYAMPQAALTNAFYNEKPKGRYGFRATIVLRLVVNAERFQQGRYMLTWCPLGGAKYDSSGSTQRGNKWVNNHSATVVQRSQLPRVEIDLNCDTEVVLRVPYASCYDYYLFDWANSLSTGDGTLGVVRIYPYSPLAVSAGSTTAGWTLFVHFEDIEFVGFAASSITVQSSNPFQTSVKKKNASEQEQQSVGVGPITGFTRKVAHASKILSPLPMLGPFAGSLSWVSNIVSDAASVFGWSAPTNIEKASRMLITNFAYNTNVNKVDNSLPLGFTTDNMVDVAPGFGGTNIDELDISYFASIPAYANAYEWPTSSAAGTKLIELSVLPSAVSSPVTYQTLSFRSYSPLAYCANKFALWRGSITYKFKVVKTEFHSGRLAVAYFPREGGTISATNTDYLHRDIIDIREHSEFSITIPWCRPEQYLSSFDNNGTLVVYIFDKLVAPDNVPSTITLIVERCGGPDIEFAGNYSNMPLIMSGDFTIQSSNPFSTKSDCTILAKPIGTTSVPKFQLDTSRLCIGERILNFRQVLKKASGIDHTILPSREFMRTFPFVASVLNTDGTTASVYNIPDFYSEMCYIFMFSRGSVRLKFEPLEQTTYNWMTVLGSNLYLALPPGNQFQADAKSSATFTDTKVNPGYHMNTTGYVTSDIVHNKVVETQVPMYSLFKARNNASNLVGNANTFSMSEPGAARVIIEYTTTALAADKPTFSKFNFSRAGGDDCNFSLFVSIPPLTYGFAPLA